VILLDDKLSLHALAGRYAAGDQAATTWTFHCRLVRALTDTDRWGAPTRDATPAIRVIATRPPPGRLSVIDPRAVTVLAASVAAKHGLDLLAAELVTSALHYGVQIELSAPKVGRRWPEVMSAEGITLNIV
jgi:hypothetical protein